MDEGKAIKLSEDAIKNISEKPPLESEAKKVGGAEQTELAEQLLADKTKEELRGLRQDIDERKIYASKAFTMLCCWLVGVFVVVLLQGFFATGPTSSLNGFSSPFFRLPDSVLLALLGGTTAGVISIFAIVANYLFPKK